MLGSLLLSLLLSTLLVSRWFDYFDLSSCVSLKLMKKYLSECNVDGGSGLSCSRITEDFCWFRKCKESLSLCYLVLLS